MEELDAGFLESDVVDYLNLDPVIVRDYRIIIFFRCPWTENVNEAITLAKKLNKKVLFDIDDLVIDKKYTELIPYIKTLSSKDKTIYDDGVMRIGKTLKLCDGAITTTEGLAKELKNYVPNVFINRNVESIIIGYFSGSITHDSDIEMIKEALIKILKENKNVQLLFIGELSEPEYLNEFSSQIIKKTFIDWRELQEIISNEDINIAPIEITIFNSAKSENKWVEAALVKVPTIASNVGAFKQVIHHNLTGLLCDDVKDWYISLKNLIYN